MNHKKIVFISFIKSLSYFSFSLIYFFGALFDFPTDSLIGKTLENIISFPSFVIFVYGYGGGDDGAFIAGLITFLVIWTVFIGITYIISWILNRTNTNKSQ